MMASIAFDLITQTAVICKELVPVLGIMAESLVKIAVSVTNAPSYM